MSHDLYNPYSPESQDSSQGPYHPSAQVGPGNLRKPSHLVVQSMHPGAMDYIPGQSLQMTELEDAIDVHLKQAREAVYPQSILKKTRQTAWPEASLGLGPTGYRTSTAVSQGQFPGYSNRLPSGSFNWPLSSHGPTSCEDSNVFSSSSPSAPNLPLYSQSSEPYPVSRYSIGGEDKVVGTNKPSTTAAGSAPSAPQSGDYEPPNHPSSSRNPEYNQNRYTCESAMDILKRFNLQEEDLEELCAYSEDQLSPANLPYLLRDIRQKKAKRSSSASQSSMSHQNQATPETMTGLGDKCDSAYQQQSKVIEYGHTSKYTGGFREEDKGRGYLSIVVRPSSLSESAIMDGYTGQSPETQPKDIAPSTYSVPVSSHGSQRSPTSSPVYSVRPSIAPYLGQRSTQTATPFPKKTLSQSAAADPIPKRESSPDRSTSAASQRPAPGAGTTSQRPAPGTNPGAVPSPMSIPINQVPPPASNASLQRPPTAKPSGKRTPTAAMISDYMGDTPKLFPHTCSLCNKPCVVLKDWLNHKEHIVHRASCRLLCRQYSEWEPDTVTLNPAPEESPPSLATSTAACSSAQSSRPSLQATSHGGPAPSKSASPLPSSCGNKSTSSVDRKTLCKSQSPQKKSSGSPQRKSSRSPQRKWSRSKSSGRKWSRSPKRKRSRSKSSGRKRSRSPQRKRSRSKSSGGKQSPRCKRTTGKASSRHVRSRRSRSSSSSNSSSPRRHYGKRSYSPARRSRRRSVSPRRGRGSPSPRDTRTSRWWSPSSRQTCRSRSGSRSSHPPSQRRRSRSQSRDRLTGHRPEETSTEQLARKLLETSGSTSLEAMVQSLAPVLLAELAKLKSSSSSSSPQDQKKPPSSSSTTVDQKKTFSSTDEQKQFYSSLTKGGNEPPSSSSSVQGMQKVLVKKSLPTKSAKPVWTGLLGFIPAHPPLVLSGLPSTVTQAQVFSAVEKFGKTRLISVSQQRREATVYFLQATAAQALLGFAELKVGGNPITVTQKTFLPEPPSRHTPKKIRTRSQPSNTTAAPGNKTATPGNKATTPGNKAATPGNKAATPGNKAAPPGNETATPGNKAATPGNGTTTPGNGTTPPGNKAATPGNEAATPGNETTIPGNKAATPGNEAATPGNETATPGNKTATPGNQAATPGNETATPGNKAALPGNKAATPGNETTTPGNKTATPGNKAAMPGNETATPGNKAATPGNKAAPPGNEKTTPGNKAATPGNKTYPPGNETTTASKNMTTPGNETTTPGNKAAPPGNKAAPPGNKTTPGNTTAVLGNTTATPGNTAATPGNETTTASKKMTSSGNKTTMPGNKTTTPGNMTATPGNETTTPGNKAAPPFNETTPPGNEAATSGNKAATPGNEMTTPGNEMTMPGNEAATPGNKTSPPGNETTTASNETTTASKKMTTARNETTTPGNKAAPPGNKAAPPGNKAALPGNRTTTTPGNTTAVLGNTTATPANETTTASKKITSSGNKTTMPGNKTTMPGNKTTMPGNKTTMPGNKTTMPGNKTTMPGNKTAMPGNKTATPGNKTATPGNTMVTPGNKTVMPGNTMVTPGIKTTTTPGNTTATPGNKTTTVGNKTTTTPGNMMTTPGIKTTTTPGNTTATPGNKTTTTPGNTTATPGNKTTTTADNKTTTTPGNTMSTPGNKTTTTPGNTTVTPGNKATTTPGNKTRSTPGNTMATPGIKTTTTPGNTTAMPGNKTTTTPGNKNTTTPGNTTVTPGNKAAPPGNKTTTPGNKTTTTPGNTTVTPSNKAAPPGNKTTTTPGSATVTPGNKAAPPGNKTTTTTPGNTMATPGNKTTTTPGNTTVTPGNKAAPPGNKTTTMPGNMMTVPGNTTATPGKTTATPGNTAATLGNKTTTTPGNKTTTPGNKRTTTPVNMTVTPGNKAAPPGNKTTTTAGNTIAVPGNTAATPGNKTTTMPGNKTTTTPGNTTTMPGNKTTTTPGNTTAVLGNTTAVLGNTTTTPLQPAEISPTVLFLKSIQCVDVRRWSLADFQSSLSSGATIMLTDLPEKARCHYREPEMIRVLERFASVECDKYFILRDNCTAFVELSAKNVKQLMDALANGVMVRPHLDLLRCHLLKENVMGSPITFYKQLLNWSEKVYDEASLPYRLVYISNFPTNEDYWMEAFRNGITKTGGVRVFLPLMGKIFVEFDTVEDADRFGVWLSRFWPKLTIDHHVHVTRPGIVLDSQEITPVSTRTRSHRPCLEGSAPPCWLVMRTLPFLYPTLSPQFSIPAHRTVMGPQDVEWAKVHLTEHSAVMVTGLPMVGYRHMDLVDEVWPYFVEKDISRVFYHVVILPLERRAFIYFDDVGKCQEFVSAHLTQPFTIGGCDLTLHFLLRNLKPCTTEVTLYRQLLKWSNVAPGQMVLPVHPHLLLLAEMDYCSMKSLNVIFNFMVKAPFYSCVVLANRVLFQLPPDWSKLCPPRMYNVLENVFRKRTKPKGVRQLEFQKVTDFMQRLCERDVKTLVKHHHSAAPTMSGQSQPGPSVPVQSRAAVLISGPTPVAPADLGTTLPQQHQAGPVSSGTQPPVLSQEMFRFFATTIRQHRQAREGQAVSQVGQQKENQQVSGELLKTSSSTSRGVESSSSTAARSSSSTEATVPSSSPSLPPPVRVVPSSSEQNTPQKKCEESPAQVSEADDTTYPTSASSQEVTRIPPAEEAESPACQPITKEVPPREAATECEGGVARLGHKMAAEASALKSAESLTGKDKLHTNPSLEEEGERKAIEAQQELTLSGQKSRVEVDETNQQMGDGKICDHMLHSEPETPHQTLVQRETPHQTLVQPEMPTLSDPASQTPEPQEDEISAKVADQCEPVQEVPEDTETVLEEEKMTVEEEQRPSAHEESPTVVSDAAEMPPGAILNGTSTEVDDTHQLMDCVEASPPKEESNEEPTEEEQNSEEPTEEAQNSKEPTEEAQNSKEPTEEAQNSKKPTEEAQNSKDPTEEAQNSKNPTEEAQNSKEPTEEAQNSKEPTEEAQNSKNPTEEAQNSKEPTEEAQNSKNPTEEVQNSKEPTEEAQNSKEPTAMKEAIKKDEQGNKEEQSAKDFAGEKENIKEEQHSKELAEEKVAPDMEQRQSKRGHPSPAAKPPSTRRSTRSSTPAKKRENPAGNPVKVEVDEQVLDSVEEGSSSTRGGGSPPSGLLMPKGQPNLEKEESDYQVVDSVECEVAEDEGVQLPTRRPTTRGKRGRAPKQTAKNARETKEQPTAPVPEEPHGPVENQDSPTRTETQDQESPEPIYHIIDSVGGEPNMEEPSKKGEEPRGKEGDAGQGISLEEVATYQVLDSVGEEVPLVTKGTRGRGRKTGERRGGKAANPPTRKDNQLGLEETMFEVLDVAEEAAEQPGRPRRGLAKKDPPPAREGKTSHHATPEGAKQNQEEKEAHPSVGAQQTAAAKRSVKRKNEEVVVSGTSKMIAKESQQMEEHGDSPGPIRRSSRRRDPAPAKTTATRTPAKATQGKEVLYQVVDSVGEEEEEQVPEEPVRGKRGHKVTRNDANTEEQALKKKKKTKEQSTAPKGDNGGGVKENVLVSLDEVSDEEEDYPNRSVEEEELRRQAVAKKQMREEEEQERKVGAEMEGLVTLDEVGEEEEEEEEQQKEGEEQERKVGAEMEGLVTLDEVGEEEEEEEQQKKEGEGEEESGITEEDLQALVTLDEIVEEEQEGEVPALEEPLPPLPGDQSEAKQREEVVSFVTVDEVGYEEQEKTHGRRARRRTRGQRQQATPKLSGQQAPPPTPLHAAPLLAGKPGAVLSDRGAGPMAESPAQDGEATAVGERREGRKASSKLRREEEGAEPKRVRSLSPSVANDYTLPPFPPDNPLGTDHVVPKAGFYCNLCSVFYEDENTAKSLHCRSLSHYRNLERCYQRLREDQSKSKSGGPAPGPAPR